MGTPINEAVFFLSQVAPARLEALKTDFPHLREELREGIFCGEEDAPTGGSSYAAERAAVMVAALEEASAGSERAMLAVMAKIREARSRRMLSQVLVLFGSSSLLGAVALDQRIVTVIAALLTLLAALGNLLAEYREKLLNPQTGNIYEAYQKLGEGRYRAMKLAAQLQISIRYKEGEAAMASLIASGNELCEQLNGWMIQVVLQSAGAASRP